jgi:hypothetical protein
VTGTLQRKDRFESKRTIVVVESTLADFFRGCLDLKIQEMPVLQGFLVIDCNGYMKFFVAHCGWR